MKLFYLCFVLCGYGADFNNTPVIQDGVRAWDVSTSPLMRQKCEKHGGGSVPSNVMFNVYVAWPDPDIGLIWRYAGLVSYVSARARKLESERLIGIVQWSRNHDEEHLQKYVVAYKEFSRRLREGKNWRVSANDLPLADDKYCKSKIDGAWIIGNAYRRKMLTQPPTSDPRQGPTGAGVTVGAP